jgi:hypothetical protein
MLGKFESYTLRVLLDNDFNDMIADTVRGHESQG